MQYYNDGLCKPRHSHFSAGAQRMCFACSSILTNFITLLYTLIVDYTLKSLRIVITQMIIDTFI